MKRSEGRGDQTTPAGVDPTDWAGHLGPRELGAYLDGALDRSELSRVEEHLAQCAGCRQEAIETSRLTKTRSGPGRGRRLAYWVAPAAAAGIAALLLWSPRGDDVGTEAPVLRSDESGATTIAVVSPTAASHPAGDSLLFVWRRVEADVVYQLTLMDEEGSVVWKRATEDTTLTLPAELELRPAARYYWHVDALLEMARSATSGVQEFVTSP